jgi:hypothetical protein
MRHPVHDILIRWLETEQYAFDPASQEYWPPGSWPGGQEDGALSDNPESSETAFRDAE